MLKKVLFGLALCVAFAAQATHNRAGEITFRSLGGLTYEITVTTYANYGAGIAFRCDLPVNWGDNTSDTLPRINGAAPPQPCYEGGEINGTVRKYVYRGVHTYATPGTYVVSMADPNRNAGVVNIPNSVNVSFYIETIIVIDPFLELNNGPVLLNPPIDEACVGVPFYHNPSAYDPDGDSLSYTLVECKADDGFGNGVNIPGFTFPPASNTFEIDPVTGELTWDSPQGQGEYNVAIAIEEWRGGKKIGRVIRDMQILVKPCQNDPPVIDQVDKICVKPGEAINVIINSTDPNGDYIDLTVSGGPFEDGNTANFIQEDSVPGASTARFTWTPDCFDIQAQPYTVVVKAEDDHSQSLVSFMSFQIEVIGPPVTDVDVQPSGRDLLVSWNPPFCSNYEELELYRAAKSIAYTPGDCETGMPGNLAYTLIDRFAADNSITTYLDKEPPAGNTYCYRLVPIYPSIARPNGIEGCLSEEACREVLKFQPAIYEVSVLNTDPANGEIQVSWIAPDTLDTAAFPGPYNYELLQAPPGGTLQQLAVLGPSVNTFNHTGINTEIGPYRYQVNFWQGNPGSGILIGSSTVAGSVFLNLQGGHESMQLSWTETVPWNNEWYSIYKLDPIGGSYVFLDTTSKTTFKDTGLMTDSTYCYYIESRGNYSGTGFPSPLLNLSQRSCGIAIDTIPPCAPSLSGVGECEVGEVNLNWLVDDEECQADIASFELYHEVGNTNTLIQTFASTENQFNYLSDVGVSGCYRIRAIDFAGNLGAFSQAFCLAACPVIEIPNVFTPNGDGQNDWFQLIDIRDVQTFKIRIFGRLGNLVYESSDPDFQWDGKHLRSQENCPDGVYYYVCSYTSAGLVGEEQFEQEGFLHLFR